MKKDDKIKINDHRVVIVCILPEWSTSQLRELTGNISLSPDILENKFLDTILETTKIALKHNRDLIGSNKEI